MRHNGERVAQKLPTMLKKMFLSLIGLVFLAIVIDVALICGFYILANSLAENTQASSMVLPEIDSDLGEIYEI